MLRTQCTIFVLLVVIFQASLAFAHEVRPTIFTLKISDQRGFELVAELNIEALVAGIGAEHEDTDDAPAAATYNHLRTLDPQAMVARFSSFAPEWIEQLGLTFDGQKPELQLDRIEVPTIGDVDLARDSQILLSGSIPRGATRMRWDYPQRYGASVLRIERPDQEIQARFYRAGVASESMDIGLAEPRSWLDKSLDYGLLGFTHILPKGLDHILFVLGLFLLNSNWKPLLVQVTAFTLAHSVTLALGLYGVVNVSPAIVEPLIALSIVYVAVENIFTRKLHAWRPVIVFLFGLLHGLGFAGILTEIGLPRADFLLGLLTFNIGVELGQLSVIALAFATFGWFSHKPGYRNAVTIPASAIVAAIGGWWFIERTLA